MSAIGLISFLDVYPYYTFSVKFKLSTYAEKATFTETFLKSLVFSCKKTTPLFLTAFLHTNIVNVTVAIICYCHINAIPNYHITPTYELF